MTENQAKEAIGSVYLLDGAGDASIVAVRDIDAIKQHQQAVWVHLNYENDDDLAVIAEHFALDEIIVEALTAESTRPRVTPFDKGLLMALRGVNLNPGANPEDMVSIRVWVNEHIMVSTSKRHLKSVDELREDFAKRNGAKNSAELVVALVERLVWHMSEFVDEMEDVIADLERSIFEESADNVRLELSMLRRKAIAARRYLAPQREALGRLLGEQVDWMSHQSRVQLREINDSLIRHVEDIDTIRERSAVMHEELNSRHSEKLNAKMYLLSIVTTIFLPLGFLTGLLGINVAGIPGSEYPHAFLIFVGMLSIVVIVLGTFFRWKRWL